MPHSTECTDLIYKDVEFVDRVLKKYKKKFDTIQACMYWADINSSIYDYLVEKGIHVVCAGYRFDSMFNSRLKTIFQLSDAIACGEAGSYIGYALYYDLPVAFFNTGASHPGHYKDNMFYWKTGDEGIDYGKVFNEELVLTKEQKIFMNDVAGFDKIREPQYFRQIHEITKDIWNFSNYEESQYAIGVYSAYNYYRKSGDIEKALILREALGENFM